MAQMRVAVPRAGEEDEPHRRRSRLLHRPEVLPSLPGGDVRVPRAEHDQGGGLHLVHLQQGGLLDVDVRLLRQAHQVDMHQGGGAFGPCPL